VYDGCDGSARRTPVAYWALFVPYKRMQPFPLVAERRMGQVLFDFRNESIGHRENPSRRSGPSDFLEVHIQFSFNHDRAGGTEVPVAD
jgi:hypothetical protein